MKQFFSVTLLITFCLIALTDNAQNVFPANGSVGIGTAVPNASAILDVRSTARGMLVPRMTQIQRNAIAAPATGLLIYQTNNAPGFYYFNSSAWVPMSAVKMVSRQSRHPAKTFQIHSMVLQPSTAVHLRITAMRFLTFIPKQALY